MKMSLPKILSILSRRVFKPTINEAIIVRQAQTTVATSKKFYSSFYCKLDKTTDYSLRYNPVGCNVTSRRFKKRKGRKTIEDDQEEEEDEDDDVEGENPLLMDSFDQGGDGSETVIMVNSLRLDTICKSAFNVQRNKVDDIFYRGDIYVNGERLTKKSADVHINDEIDMIRGHDPEDPTKTLVSRVQIMAVPDKIGSDGRMGVTIKKWPQMSIDLDEQKPEE